MTKTLTGSEMAVIEAAQDLVLAWEAAHYGPGKQMVKDSEKALQQTMADLWADCEGQWVSPV